MDLMDEELRRVLAGSAEPVRPESEFANEMRRLRARDAARPPSASEIQTASRPSFRMSSAGRRTQRGGGEALETLGSAILGSVPAGLAGLASMPFQGVEGAAKTIERVQDYLTVDPQTEGGVRALRGIAGALSPLGAIPQAAGDATLRATSSPLLATVAELLVDPLNLLGIGATAKPIARGAAAAGRGAAKAGKATVENLGPKAAEMAEAYMRRAGMMPDIFIGKSAKTWDAASNARAVEMEKAGADPRDIWSQTGNWRAPDGQWRQEISDAPLQVGRAQSGITPEDGAKNESDKQRLKELKAKMNALGAQIDEQRGSSGRVSNKLLDEYTNLRTEENVINDNIWMFSQKQKEGDVGKVGDLVQGPLLEAYPSLGEFKLKDQPKSPYELGAYDKKNKSIVLRAPEQERKPVFVHEGQHFVQDVEGFSPGSPPKDSSFKAHQDYLRFMGEAEARAAQRRSPLSETERRATFPEESYDVPISELRDVERQGPATALATVYHGTPHTFAPEEGAPLGRFRSEKIGTGEGAQAYGHGLYLAEEPGVARTYRSAGVDQSKFVPLRSIRDPAQMAATALERAGGDVGHAQAVLAANADRGDTTADAALQLLKQGKKLPESKYAGSLYKVDLPDLMVDKMLDWGKPLSKQPAAVQEAISRIMQSDVLDADTKKLIGGKDIKASKFYEALASSDTFAGKGPFGAAASEYLMSQGIPGIKYLDNQSRAAGQGTRNFVVFPGEEKNLTILQRNEQRLPQTDTPAFREWFGNSDVVDDAGKPLVFYHGGESDFAGIRAGGQYDGAIFVRQGAPSGYGKAEYPLYVRGPILEINEMAGLLSSDRGRSALEKAVRRPLDDNDSELLKKALTDGSHYPTNEDVWSLIGAIDEADAQVEIQRLRGAVAKDLGFKAVRTPDEFDGETVMVLSPEQIKSAIGNRGTFDAKSPDITKAQGGPVGGNMSYTQAADVIADKLIRQGMDSDQAFMMALRMSDARMKAGGAVLMNEGGDPTEEAERQYRMRRSAETALFKPEPVRMRKSWDGPMPNRQVVNGRKMVSAEELADFRRQFGASMTLRDLLNADQGRGPSAAMPAARGVQGANIKPAGPRVRPDETATLPSMGAADVPGLIMQGMQQGAQRVPAGRGAGAAFVGAGAPRAAMAAKTLRDHPSITPAQRQMLKEMDDYINALNKERVDPPGFAEGGKSSKAKPLVGIAPALRGAARTEARLAEKAAQEAAQKALAAAPPPSLTQAIEQANKTLLEGRSRPYAKPDTVRRMIIEEAVEIAKNAPKLKEGEVSSRAQRQVLQRLKWERETRPELQSQYGELAPSSYDMPAPRRMRNTPEVVAQRAENARAFLAKPTEPWAPPPQEKQAFERSLIKDALEGFPGIEQTRFPRYESPRANVDYINEIYDDPKNRSLIKQQITRGLPLGGESFYGSLYPVKVAALERGIPAEKFDQFIYQTAPASARNSIMNEMAVGQFMRDMKARGLPLDEDTVTAEMAKFKEKYGTGLPLMPIHRQGVQNVIEGGLNMRDMVKADIPTNYKIPTYGTQKAGDFGKSFVLDVHEAAGETQGSRYHPYFTEQGGFGPTEYGLAESKMLDIANEMGIPGGMAQAGRWFGGGELTGLKSPRGDALDLLEKQAAYTLQGMGINPTPKVVRDYILNMIDTGEGVLMPWFKGSPMPDVRTVKKEGGEVTKRQGALA